MDGFAIALMPLLLLLAALVFGRYPGCEAILRLSERIASRPRALATKSQPRPYAPLTHAASGGLLLAFGVATRPPPLAS